MSTLRSRHSAAYFHTENAPLSMYLSQEDKPVITAKMYLTEEEKPDQVHKTKLTKKCSPQNMFLCEEGKPDLVSMTSPYHGKLNMSFPPTKRSSRHYHHNHVQIPLSPPVAYYPARMSFSYEDKSFLSPMASPHLQHPGRMPFSDEDNSFLPLMGSPYPKNHARQPLLDEENSFSALTEFPLHQQHARIIFSEDEKPFLDPMEPAKVPFSWEEKPGVPISPTAATHLHQTEGPFFSKDPNPNPSLKKSSNLPSPLPIPPGRLSSAITFNDRIKEPAKQRKSPATVLSNHCRPPSKIHHSPEHHILPKRSIHCRRQAAEDPFQTAMENCTKTEGSHEDHKLTNPRLSPKYLLNKIFESGGDEYGTSRSPLKKLQKRFLQKPTVDHSNTGSLFASCMGCKSLDSIILA